MIGLRETKGKYSYLIFKLINITSPECSILNKSKETGLLYDKLEFYSKICQEARFLSLVQDVSYASVRGDRIYNEKASAKHIY
ncbi:hypothetical protein DSM106972_081220 [Dulcicalothrix desertica PCC 7102]|uniref:Uncharacterized protein n=1 Tax=Dulcicalothrix desertica PCC 7102 TaxID=232991 RepID=A0A3S1IK25_9CYAN|nr:hypothetical protein DSM106972_081220 [Dulcicalothrix desertica PCC 7102]TWH49737.1 hypothetical protein CAL7102_03960 [Dulcicalothrix desertica PCC 7102]